MNVVCVVRCCVEICVYVFRRVSGHFTPFSHPAQSIFSTSFPRIKFETLPVYTLSMDKHASVVYTQTMVHTTLYSIHQECVLIQGRTVLTLGISEEKQLSCNYM